MTPEPIRSKDNPLIKSIRAVSRDSAAYKRDGVIWVEGDHLIRAALARRWTPKTVVWTEAALALWPDGLKWPGRHVEVDAATMKALSQLESAAPLGALFELPQVSVIRVHEPTVILDRLQDPGNVGSILRTASAMGFTQILALQGTVGLWSPKVVRAGMGAHFNLDICEGVQVTDLCVLKVPLLVTHVHEGEWLHSMDIPAPCAWVFGHEGQGASAEILECADHRVRIHQVGGEESLNVAAAAAICLHASASGRQRSGYN